MTPPFRRLTLNTAALCSLALFTACTPSHPTPPAASALPEIPLVQSFDDLQKSPPITVGAEQIHLGLESTTCPANSGILVYCSPVSGNVNFSHENIPYDEQLGPVGVTIVYPDKDFPKYAKSLRKYMVAKREGPVMFVFAIRPRKPGPCEIQILAPDNTLLAHRQIEVTNPQPTPWLTFNPPEVREKLGSV